MKKSASFLLVLAVLLCFTAQASEKTFPDYAPRPICTVDEFIEGYNHAVLTIDESDTSKTIYKENFDTSYQSVFVIYSINITEYINLMLACKKGEEIVYSISFAYSPPYDDLIKPISAVIFAAGLQDTVFDFSFEAVKQIGAMGRVLNLGDTGIYEKNGLTADWVVMGDESKPIHFIKVFRYKNNKMI